MLASRLSGLAQHRCRHTGFRHTQTRRVALLGIAQRQIRIKYAQKTRKQQRSKPLPASIQTIGDWIQVKRQEKNLSPCHLAAKMGIATALVRSWENGTAQADSQQLKVLADLLEFKTGMLFSSAPALKYAGQPGGHHRNSAMRLPDVEALGGRS
jgi:ribosome-binding protein aMBF1 (putative translation factor)